MIIFASRGQPGYGHAIPQTLFLQKYPSIKDSIEWISYGPAVRFVREMGFEAYDLGRDLASTREFWFPGLDVFEWVDILQGRGLGTIDCVITDGELNAPIACSILGIPSLLILSTNYFHNGLHPYSSYARYFRFVAKAAAQTLIYGLADPSELVELPKNVTLFGPIARTFAHDTVKPTRRLRVLLALGHIPMTGRLGDDLRLAATQFVEILRHESTIEGTIAAENIPNIECQGVVDCVTHVNLAIDHGAFDVVIARPGLNVVCEALLRSSKIQLLDLASTQEYDFLLQRVQRFGHRPMNLKDLAEKGVPVRMKKSREAQDDTDRFTSHILGFIDDHPASRRKRSMRS